jgi:hypothetical protein
MAAQGAFLAFDSPMDMARDYVHFAPGIWQNSLI